MDNERIIKAFGENLKSIRLKKGWTQTKLGVEAGMEPQHVGKLERGLHEPGIVTAVMLARALECNISDLISA
ncbi:helix-turn-helix transcriptional regulator [Chitinophaga agrisoli]|uniref:Helix-turn-helix transcriptional regulator n=1 Tax=Chitinophaga agrisoli TaxID=2607653 RepID=A0A5B2VXN3_9BACT|nr:helix-turn-helix transcriptional regulator [Chitinophaga agrisoli]